MDTADAPKEVRVCGGIRWLRGRVVLKAVTRGTKVCRPIWPTWVPRRFSWRGGQGEAKDENRKGKDRLTVPREMGWEERVVLKERAMKRKKRYTLPEVEQRCTSITSTPQPLSPSPPLSLSFCHSSFLSLFLARAYQISQRLRQFRASKKFTRGTNKMMRKEGGRWTYSLQVSVQYY